VVYRAPGLRGRTGCKQSSWLRPELASRADFFAASSSGIARYSCPMNQSQYLYGPRTFGPNDSGYGMATGKDALRTRCQADPLDLDEALQPSLPLGRGLPKAAQSRGHSPPDINPGKTSW